MNSKQRNKGYKPKLPSPAPDTSARQLLLLLAHMVKAAQEAQQQVVSLTATNEQLQGQIEQQGQQLEQAQSRNKLVEEEMLQLQTNLAEQDKALTQAEQRIADLHRECESLQQQVIEEKAEAKRSHTQALVELFKDMADDKHNRLLFKLLTADGSQFGALAEDVARYFKEQVKLVVEGQKDGIVELNEGNINHYEIHERVDLPCKAEIIRRGISFEGHSILRIQVEPLEESSENGH